MRTLRSIQYFFLALVILAVPATSHAQFSASIHDRAAGTGRLLATDLPTGRLSLDAGLLGLWRRRLLLGAGHMG